jgi:protein O-GlcNAc transferase
MMPPSPLPIRAATLAIAVCVVPGFAPRASAAEARDYLGAFNRGEYAKAFELARQRVAADPKDIEARIIQARADAALGRLDAAYQGFREALRVDPANADALYYVGFTAGVLAQAEYDRLLGLAPESARAHQLLAESQQAQGRAKEAEAEYKAVLAKNPRAVDALVALGDITRKGLRLEEALGYYSRALEMAPRSYDAHYGLGACLAYQGKQAEAVASFRKALALDPASGAAHLALGISLLQTGQNEAAAAELEAATRLEPKMRQAYYQLGRAYQALGRTADAEAAFAKMKSLLRGEMDAAEETLAPDKEKPEP